MTLRAPPGPQVATGRLRVDAAKAIAKLREYQLVDRTAWVLEAIRAAIASGATALDLQGDSNDIWLSWTGVPWPADDLPRLFDELVSPEPGASRQHLRLLAAAVNSALGANPAYVDVYTIGGTGAMRCRYTPEVLEVATDGELGESPLRRLQVQAAPIPPHATRGMHVHFRRRASLEVLSYWLRAAPPPELELARWACADTPVPIRIGDTTYERAANPRDIVRVPLGADLDGWLAVTDGAAGKLVALDIAERGVLLESTTIDLDLGELRAEVPLRVFVDAARMPTNASRSEVRRDAHPIATVYRRAKEQVPELVAALTAKLGAPAEPRACAAAIRLVGAIAAGDDWNHAVRELAGPLAPLAQLPLVRDAAGVPRRLAWPWNGLVHVGDEPFPEELASWLVGVLWAPPGSALRWLPDADADGLRVYIRRAKRERRAQKRFYKHAPREPRVEGRRKHRVRARLGAPLRDSCIPDGVFAGLTGEVCIYADRPGGELAILLEGRELERVELESSLAFAAVIDGARVQPTISYTGAVRDAEYTRVERAMRAGVVRAIEALALARQGSYVDGYQVASEGDGQRDLELVRAGVLLARNLGAQPGPALANAKLWRTTEGWLSLAVLRTHAVLGVTSAGHEVPAMQGRVIVHADETERALLATLVDARLVPYEPGQLRARVAPHELAEQVRGASTHAFALGDWEETAALVPADTPKLIICHRGRALAEHAYTPALQPCTIHVDSDRVVPDADWAQIVDDGGLATRDYRAWEHALARAAVRALTGEVTSGLVGPTPLPIDSALARWLWLSLADPDVDPAAVLGAELLAQLRTCSLFRVLGESHRQSVDELAVLFPEVLYHVETATDLVHGFPVVIASAVVANAIGRLASRRVQDGTSELANHRRRLARELRLASHRAKPLHVRALTGPTVEIASELGKGVVGLGADTFELDVLVEGRLFQAVTQRDELPLVAVFELTDLSAADDRFEELRPDVAQRIAAGATSLAGDLLAKLAEAHPPLLADSGAARTLLARFVRRGALALALRDHLARTIRFPTVNGERATFVEARSGPIIQTSTWHGEWLGPDGDPDPSLDRPILATYGSPELEGVLGALGNVVDVTVAVERLQTRRRIARGLLPAPAVRGADPRLTRRLPELGPQFRQLGPGEVALASGAGALLVHAAGELRERKPLSCTPPIELAIEAPDLVTATADLIDRRIGNLVRELALAVAREVIAAGGPTLPAEIRRNLRAAILAGKLADVRDVPVFETTAGTWIDLAAVQAQRELFGQLWSVAEVPYDATPLDDRRIVLVLSTEHQVLAAEHGIPVIDATHELALDAKTRRNRARPPAESLAIPDDGVLAKVPLMGDGITAPRGWIGVLAPDAIHQRRLRMFRAMHPFDDAPDQCRWPTFATVDDARFTPDRTWSEPQPDDIYTAAIELVHRTSADALRSIVTPPATALAAVRIEPWAYAGIAALRNTDTQIAGALWISGPPIPTISPSISVIETSGEHSFVPLRGPGITGKLYVHPPSGWKREPVLEELCQIVHARLARELALMADARDPDLVSAHVAWALATDRITADDAKRVKFQCFKPSPLTAPQLLELLRSHAPVTLIPPFTNYTELALVDDGSETARVIKTWVGPRLRPALQPRSRGDTEPLPPPPIEKPVVAHPLQRFVDTLHARIGGLGIAVRAWRIVDDREHPVAKYADDGVLELAGANRHVIALAAAVTAKGAWANDGVDALAAHCITVLNIAMTAITDATEGAAIAKLLG